MASFSVLIFCCGISLILGLNQDDRSIAEELAYQKCKRSEQDSGSFHKKYARAVFEDQHVRLNCTICLPTNDSQSEIKWWKDGIKINHSGSILTINRATQSEAGVYLCTAKNEAKVSTDLHILSEDNEIIQKVRMFDKPHSKKNMTLKTALGEVEIYSEWTHWSRCSERSNCGYVGLKRKYGPCMMDIKSHTNLSTRIWTNPLPCRSNLAPLELLQNLKIKSRPSEVMFTFCKVKCSTKNSSTFKVFDKTGNLLDEVDNSKGVYSIFQGIPQLHPPAHRYNEFRLRGEKLKLKCPGYFSDDSPIQWLANNKIIGMTENGRVKSTPLQRIEIKTLKMSDSKIYSCWQQGKLVGTIQVRVMEPGMTSIDTAWTVLILFVASAVIIFSLVQIYFE